MTKKPTKFDWELRRRAEEKLRADPAAHQKNSSVENMEKLFHELQVYQIQLQMQNEELNIAQHELATSKTRYLDIYDQAPVGYLTISERGVVVEANTTAAAMLGVDKKALLKKTIYQFVCPEDKDICDLNRKNLYSEMNVQTWEMRMMHPDGSMLWLLLLATPAVGGELWVVTDISERKRIERVLKSRVRISKYAVNHSLEELLTKLVDEAEALTGSQIGFIHFFAEDESRLTLHTWSTNTLSNTCTSETKGNHHPLESAGVWADCIRARKPLIHNDYAALTNRKGLPSGHAPVQRELVVPIVRNNVIVAVLGVGNKLTDYNEYDITIIEKLTALAWDFVALKQSENNLLQAHADLETRVAERTVELVHTHEQMKRVSFDLLWAEERERERIAAELHDRVGQSLLLAKMKLDALADQIPADNQRVLAVDAISLLETSIKDIRSLTFRIRPPILDSSGIEVALEWLCSSMARDYGLIVNFTTDGQLLPTTAEIRYSLYQAVRELLLNVAKHAKVGNVELSIKADNEFLMVQVEDSGAGFDYGAANKAEEIEGYGLYNVMQRAEQMGGKCAVESAPGRGTSVTLTLPVANLGRQEREGNEHDNTPCRRSSDFS